MQFDFNLVRKTALPVLFKTLQANDSGTIVEFLSENLSGDKEDTLDDVLAAATRDAGIDDLSSYFIASSQSDTPAASSIEQENEFQDWDFFQQPIQNDANPRSASGSQSLIPNEILSCPKTNDSTNTYDMPLSSGQDIIDGLSHDDSFVTYTPCHYHRVGAIGEPVTSLQDHFCATNSNASACLGADTIAKKRKLSQDLGMPEKRHSNSLNYSPHSFYEVPSSSSLNGTNDSILDEKR